MSRISLVSGAIAAALVLPGGLAGCSGEESGKAAAPPPPKATQYPQVPGVPPLPAGVSPSPAGFGPAAGLPGAAGAPPMPPLPGPPGDRDWALERQKEEIAAADRDGDGMLSQEEYLNRYIERHKRRFEMLDFDKNGKLTAEEMADLMDPQKMMERAGAAAPRE